VVIRKLRFVGVIVVLASLGAVAAQQVPWRPVVVRLPAEVPVAAVSACITDDGVTGLQPSQVAPGAIDAQCSLTTLVRCSIPGTEPVDLDVGALCRGGMARVEPAVRFVRPTWPARDPVIVEWRAWGDSVSTLLATRLVDPAAGADVPLAAAVRLLRILRVGASPVTLVVPSVSESPVNMPPQDLTAAVPIATPGGELFLFLDEREREARYLTLQGPETRVVGIDGAPFLSLPGLPPGDYTLRFGTPDVPEGAPVDFAIRDTVTTELVPRLPVAANEFRISGVVTFNGAPLPQQALEVVDIKTDETLTVTTDEKGRYTLLVPMASVYVVRAVSTYDFGQLEAQAAVDVGETQLDLNLTGAHVRLVFLVAGGQPSGPIEFFIEGPQRFSGIASDFRQPTELTAIPYGNYTVRASADPNFVAEAMPLAIDGTPGIRTLTLDLQEQRATLRVVSAAGGEVPGVRARAGQQILRAATSGMSGTFDVARISPGAEIVVRAPGHVPACVALSPNIENLVQMQTATATLQIRFEFEALRVPPGRIRFNDADRCAVPLEEFEFRRVAGGFEITNMPSGAPMTYEYGAQRIPLLAPGDPVIIR
jgi:hypothetical protein